MGTWGHAAPGLPGRLPPPAILLLPCQRTPLRSRDGPQRGESNELRVSSCQLKSHLHPRINLKHIHHFQVGIKTQLLSAAFFCIS